MSITRLNMMSILFYLYIFILVFIGTVLLVNGWPPVEPTIHLSHMVRQNAWMAVMYAIIMLPFSMLVTKYFLVGSTKSSIIFNNFTLKNIAYSQDRFALIIFSALNVFVLLGLFICLGKFPLLVALSGKSSSHALGVLRYQISHRNLFLNTLFKMESFFIPVLSFVAYYYWAVNKKGFDFIWFIVMFIASVIALTYNLHKGSVVIYFLGFLVAWTLMGRTIKFKYLVSIGFIIFLFIIIEYFFILDSASLNTALTSIFNRTFIGQIEGTFCAFQLYPNQIPFVMHTGLSPFLSALLYLNPQQVVSRVIMVYFLPGAVTSGIAGVMNSFFIQEAWGMLGWWGVLFSPIYLGILFEFLYLFFLHAKKTPLMLALFVYFSYTSGLDGGFNSYIFNKFYFTVIFLLVVYIQAFRLLIKSIKNNSKVS